VSKKKGMLSWLGLGKQEEQTSNADQVIDEQNSSQVAVESIENSSEVTQSNLTEAKISAEVNSSLNAATKDASHLQPEVEVASSESGNFPQAGNEVSDEKEQTAELSDNFESDEIVEKEVKLGFFARLKRGLSKTSENLSGGLVDLFRGKQIDDELFEELETHLLLADVGVETTMKIIDSLTQSASRKELKDASALHDLLKVELQKVIEPVNKPLVIKPTDEQGPFVILMVGVNGVGKTTTIGKLAKQFQGQGKSVMLAAGDTFRAAAVEQLQVWGERNDIPVIAQHTGADSASVIFDAISAAKARQVDVIIADTAGRLQNKAHLMEELKKVVRVMKKLDVKAPHEVMLTLDAGTGQNALSQTKLFDEAVGLTGLTITKLDGTAKGGVIFAIADKYNIPIRYLGVGEGIDDLRPFDGNDFIEALFNH
jgi:fused signal recognition particle receptor